MTIVSFRSNLAFIHIPKCGGSSVEFEWQRLGSREDFVIGSTPEGEALQPHFHRLCGLHKHNTAWSLRNVLGRNEWRSLTTAVLVREPRKIVESWYKFAAVQANYRLKENDWQLADLRAAIVAKDETLPPWWFRFRETLVTAMMSDCFEDFVERVLDRRWSKFLQRYTNDKFGNRIVTHVFKLEELDQVNRFFQGYLGPDFKLERKNAGKDLTTEWNPDHLRRFLDLTEKEYLIFGYRI
jgi:hypothetical protein